MQAQDSPNKIHYNNEANYGVIPPQAMIDQNQMYIQSWNL